MSILVGIDGTGGEIFSGSGRDARYDAEFANSFVRRICGISSPNTKYLRGPRALGGDLLDAVGIGHTFILERRRAGVDEPILLVGYSRGAAGVIAIAQWLQRDKIDVEAMILFDCVSRHLRLGSPVQIVPMSADTIPTSVRYAAHFMRSPASGSRSSFGNAGTIANEPTVYRQVMFVCTHGGMGGTPWPVPEGQTPEDFIVEAFPDGKTNVTYAQDAIGADRVWSYAKPFMIEHGFPPANPMDVSYSLRLQKARAHRASQ